MLAFWRRLVVRGLLVFVVTVTVTVMVGRHASSNDCVYGHRCAEDKKDGHGCCPPPDADAKADDAKKAADARKVAEEKRAAEEKSAADASAVPASCPTDMVRVPGGTFLMGGPAGVGDDDEHPQHRVTLSGYCIDKTEVTVVAYTRCVASGKCTAAREPAKKGWDSLCNGTRADRQDHPVNCMDWNQARAYCGFVNKRLPSEAEWEYAARGSDGRSYPWGNEAPSVKRLNACDSQCRALAKRLGVDWKVMYEDGDGWEATAPVGSFPGGASPFGAQDMAGNVWEWTADWYGSYTADASTNPHGPKDGSFRVQRGGGWFLYGVTWVRATNRERNEPAIYYGYPDLGFRCARGE